MFSEEALDSTRRLVNELGSSVSGKSLVNIIAHCVVNGYYDMAVKNSLAHAMLASRMMSTGAGWFDRIMLVNLKDNDLTDLACNVIVISFMP